jgi:acetone carboxylase gamma subunit
MTERISETLEIRGEGGRRNICCRSCGHAMTPAGTSWKRHAALSAIPVRQLPGASSAVHPDVVSRRFSCPKCGSLLDSETALPDDPYLDDVVLA